MKYYLNNLKRYVLKNGIGYYSVKDIEKKYNLEPINTLIQKIKYKVIDGYYVITKNHPLITKEILNLNIKKRGLSLINADLLRIVFLEHKTLRSLVIDRSIKIKFNERKLKIQMLQNNISKFSKIVDALTNELNELETTKFIIKSKYRSKSKRRR